MSNFISVGSVCSGIEAASVAWVPLGYSFEWFSEIADFPSKILAERYPSVPNLGDMTAIPQMILSERIPSPDILCGGTPCQAFSLAGWKNGLNDDRGNLTLRLIDIANANDIVRAKNRQPQCRIFWENVEGVLTDKTNAFGCFVSSLAGFDDAIYMKKWPVAGIIHGLTRNIAWRVLDAKYFGLAQQRRRLYVLAGGTDFFPERVLFEMHRKPYTNYPQAPLVFSKDGHCFEVFREYTDCLYSAYGTKWNGNAAAYNGSLYVVQDNRIRRISPLEGERLMGFPDDYTNLEGAKRTSRYQAIGNSWAVPVIRWIGERMLHYGDENYELNRTMLEVKDMIMHLEDNHYYVDCSKDVVDLVNGGALNCSAIPENCIFSDMRDVVSANAPEEIYISPVGCYGIVRRKRERNLKINARLEQVLLSISSQMDASEIEKRSRIQKRGRFSDVTPTKESSENINHNSASTDDDISQLSIFS